MTGTPITVKTACPENVARCPGDAHGKVRVLIALASGNCTRSTYIRTSEPAQRQLNQKDLLLMCHCHMCDPCMLDYEDSMTLEFKQGRRYKPEHAAAVTTEYSRQQQTTDIPSWTAQQGNSGRSTVRQSWHL